MSSTNSPSLTANYTSPTSTHTFSSSLPTLQPGNASTEEKTAYLSALRSNVSQLQGDVNTFLTQKMEEDKAREAEAVGGADGKRVRMKDEEREEEMYGEEDVEEEG